MSKMSDWVLRTFPLDASLDWYRNLNGLHHYLDTVAEMAGPGGRVVEVGIGSGLALAHWRLAGLEVLGIDNDPDVLALAAERYARMGVTGISLQLGDAWKLTLPMVDVICHEGLLEHFDRLDRLALLRYHLLFARVVVVDIPTSADIPPGGGFGDERLQSAEEWLAEWGDFNLVRYYRRATAIGGAFVS